MSALTVVDRPHASVSPSAFARVEACTASYRLASQAPPREASVYADRGTALHAIFEKCLTEALDTFEVAGIEGVDVGGRVVAIEDHDLDGLQAALDWLRTDPLTRDRAFEVERTLHLDFAEAYLGKPIYGYADVLYRDPPVTVVDLKTGSQPVEPSSTQLGLYILAAVLATTGGSLHGKVVEPRGDAVAGHAVILQPSGGGEVAKVHAWTWTALRALRDRVVATLEALGRQEWRYKAGEHCRWCPAIGICPHIAAMARDAALAEVAPSPEAVAQGDIGRELLDEWVRLIPTLDRWARAVMRTAEDYLVHGGKLDNAKLVRKRTNRRWVLDEDGEAGIARALEHLGLTPWTNVLISPAQAEKALPKDLRKELADLVEKPTGDLTIAPADDPREGVVVHETLRAALAANQAAGFLAASSKE